jgi:hypothetical protein
LAVLKDFEALPQIGPFSIGMMEKITVTAVITAALTRKLQRSCSFVVGCLHIMVEFGHLPAEFRR